VSGFTRLTIVGRSRKAEIVVPGDETIAALIPQLMDLLEERTGSVARPLTLVRATGQQLDTALTSPTWWPRPGTTPAACGHPATVKGWVRSPSAP
jgi:hypothetical protein